MYSQSQAPRKGDPVSLNSCVPICVSVLANPVTNSVYYNAAMSRLPRQGCIPTEVVYKAQRIISWILPHHPSLERTRHFICLFPEPASALAFFWFLPFSLPAPSCLPPLLGSVYLLIWGWGCAQSESGPGSQSRLLWGIPGDETHDPFWKRIFQKIPFGHRVVTAPFSVHVQWAWPRACLPEAPVLSEWAPGVGRETSTKNQVWWSFLPTESLVRRNMKMQISLTLNECFCGLFWGHPQVREIGGVLLVSWSLWLSLLLTYAAPEDVDARCLSLEMGVAQPLPPSLGEWSPARLPRGRGLELSWLCGPCAQGSSRLLPVAFPDASGTQPQLSVSIAKPLS